MGGVGTFDKECRTLYVGGLANRTKLEKLLWSEFGEWGEIEVKIYIARNKSKKCVQVTQQLCTCITLFCAFLCCHCITMTWKCLFLRFLHVEDVYTRLSFSFPELRYSLLEFEDLNETELIDF